MLNAPTYEDLVMAHLLQKIGPSTEGAVVTWLIDVETVVYEQFEQLNR